MEAEFQPVTWKACWECVVRGRPAAEVAAELGVTPNAVYLRAAASCAAYARNCTACSSEPFSLTESVRPRLL